MIGAESNCSKCIRWKPQSMHVSVSSTFLLTHDNFVRNHSPSLLEKNGERVHYLGKMLIPGDVVVAMGHAGWMLVPAGVLTGKTATRW